MSETKENVENKDISLNTLFEHIKKIEERIKQQDEAIKNLENNKENEENEENDSEENNNKYELKLIEESISRCPILKNNLENLDFWLFFLNSNLRSYSKYLESSSSSLGINNTEDDSYSFVKNYILQTVEEQVFYLIRPIREINQIIIYLKKEKENNRQYQIRNLENSIKQLKYNLSMNFEEIVLQLLEKIEQLKKIGVEKTEEEIINEIVKLVPTPYNEEVRNLMDPTNLPIKNIFILTNFIRMKKEEENKKKFNNSVFGNNKFQF